MNRNFKGGNRPRRVSSYMDQTTYGYNGKPSETTDVKDRLSIKAMRDLPKSSYSLKADPYTAALPTSEPYPLLDRFLKVVSPSYKGDDNIDGGNVQQYANSVTSKFLCYFDAIRTNIRINYRYLPILPSEKEVGYALIDEMRKSIAESISILKSTTFTQMAINHFAVVTDMAMGSATTTNIAPDGQTELLAYTDTTDVIYAMAIYYQLFIQNGLSAFNWHNSFRLKQGTMIRNAWNREVPNLNGFFGLMNKKSFLNVLDSLALSFEGEYVDTDFAEQMNILTLTPSRRSNAMTDPVLELQVDWEHPSTFQIYILDDNGTYISANPFFDNSMLKGKVPALGLPDDDDDVDYWTACDSLRDYLSLEATTLWARSAYASAEVMNDNKRFNIIKDYFQLINKCFVIFKPLWADFREAFDTMYRTGTLNWKKGFRPSVVKDTTADLFQNLLVDDIMNMIFSGADVIDFDTATKRWRYFSKWNMYHGIPAYDVKSGGSFLALSFKKSYNIVESDEDTLRYLPILFNYDLDKVSTAAVSRDGIEVAIEIGTENMDANIVLSRLAPLVSQSSLDIRVPSVTGDSGLTVSLAHLSSLYKTLTQIFGVARIRESDIDDYDYAVDPDIIAIYQIEVSDITNMAITYARANAPFRGTTSSADLLGFKG